MFALYIITRRESRDFKTITMADTIEKIVDSGKISLIYQLILLRFAWGLKQISQKNDRNMPIVCNLRTNIWLKSSVSRQLLFNQIFV